VIYTGPTGIPSFLQHGGFRMVFHTVSVCSAVAFIDPARITEKSRERRANDKSYNEVHLVASKKLRITSSLECGGCQKASVRPRPDIGQTRSRRIARVPELVPGFPACRYSSVVRSLQAPCRSLYRYYTSFGNIGQPLVEVGHQLARLGRHVDAIGICVKLVQGVIDDFVENDLDAAVADRVIIKN
jgi:hypothetical protein